MKGPWIRGLLVGIALGAIAAWQLHGSGRWVWATVILFLAPPVNAWLNPPEALWLEGNVLFHQVRKKTTSLDLGQPVYVSRSFVPKKGDDLVLDGANGAQVIIWCLGPQTEALRREIGERPTLRSRGTGSLDPKTKQLLLRD